MYNEYAFLGALYLIGYLLVLYAKALLRVMMRLRL